MSDRYHARTNLLRERSLIVALETVVSFLEHHDQQCALVGGLAVAYHANPPVTADVDLLVDGYWKDLLARCKAEFRPQGWRVTVFGFPTKMQRPGQPMKGVRLVTPDDITFDLLTTSRDEYLRSVLDRSEHVVVASVDGATPVATARLRVATPEDLIVMKTMSDRDKDQEDIAALRSAGKTLDEAYVLATMLKLGIVKDAHFNA